MHEMRCNFLSISYRSLTVGDVWISRQSVQLQVVFKHKIGLLYTLDTKKYARKKLALNKDLF